MTDEPKLDSCPFCGANDIQFSRYDGSLYCFCNGCGSRGINANVLTAAPCECHPDDDQDAKNKKIVEDALIKVATAWNRRV